jgi:hypothetical protein
MTNKYRLITIDPGVKNCCVVLWEKAASSNQLEFVKYMKINFIGDLKYNKSRSSTWVNSKIERWAEDNKAMIIQEGFQCNDAYIECPFMTRWINIATAIGNVFAFNNHWVPLYYREMVHPHWRTGSNYKYRKQQSIDYFKDSSHFCPDFKKKLAFNNTTIDKLDDLADAIMLGDYVSKEVLCLKK